MSKGQGITIDQLMKQRQLQPRNKVDSPSEEDSLKCDLQDEMNAAGIRTGMFFFERGDP